MREYIFSFPQSLALRFNLSLSDLLFLDYFYNFASSGAMRYIYHNGKKYYKLTYKKIMDDLPILNKKERQIIEMITNLEKKEFIERYRGFKNQMYIFVDYDVLFGYKPPKAETHSAENHQDVGEKMPAIDNYNNNLNIKREDAGKQEKIKLKDRSGTIRVDTKVDLNLYTTIADFEKEVKRQAIELCGDVVGKLYFSDLKVTNINKDYILFFFVYKESVLRNFKEQFKFIAQSAIKKVVIG